MITDWNVPFRLISPLGTLILNTLNVNGDQYVLLRDGCNAQRPLRVTVDQIPQGDGTIIHRRFTEGYQIQMKVDFWHGGEPACDSDLQRMSDTLLGHLNAMLNADDARIQWTPADGSGDRIFTNVHWREFPTYDAESGGTALQFLLDTEFPYEISSLQTTPVLGGTITNNGNTDFFPVLHIDGPSSAFLVTNGSEGIVYDSSRPGASAIGSGHYVEIDCFRNTIVLDGNVQDLDAGVDPNLSSFFTFPPGSVTSGISGATGYVLMNDAWA